MSIGPLVRAAMLPAWLAAQAPPASPPVIIYRGASLIDGTGAPLRAGVAIVTRGSLIEAVTPNAELATPPGGAEIVDVSGLFVIPGLINSHVHLATSPNRARAEAMLQRNLYHGVTAVRDMAGDARALADLARAALAGEIPAADVYYSALMGGPALFGDARTARSSVGVKPGEAPWMRAITAQTDLAVAVAEARGTSASGLKIYATLPADLVSGLTKEAHRQRFKVWAHAAVFPASPADIVAAGVDVISHIWFFGYQLAADLPHQYPDRSVESRLMAEIGVKYTDDAPTLMRLFEAMRKQGLILDATLRQAAGADRREGKPLSQNLAVRMAKQAYRAGVMISAGTDGETPPEDPEPALLDELELLADGVGMPPLEVIRSATLVGAMTVDRASEMGTITPGKLANLVFLEKNPLESIKNIRTVRFTVKRGIRYRRPSAPR